MVEPRSDGPRPIPCALEAVSADEWGYADIEASTLEILEGMRQDANERLARYKQELGISD